MAQTGGGDASWTWSMADPWAIAAVAIAGGILLLFGGRLLKPALIIAVIALGAALGLDLAEGTRTQTLPSWFLAAAIPGVVWLIVTPLLAGILAALLVRVALAVLLGIATASVVLLVGVAIARAGGGGEMTEPPPAAVVSTSQADGAADRVGSSVAEHVAVLAGSELAELGPLPDFTTVVPAGLRAWWAGVTASIAPGTLDLVISLSVVAGICGFLVCLLVPDRTSIWATAIAGGWLLSAAGLAAWARMIAEGREPTPLIPLLAWAILVGVGVLYQCRRGGKPAPRRE